jgi:hypothetical protein
LHVKPTPAAYPGNGNGTSTRSRLIPILGPTLSRLREYSDRNGAALEPNGELADQGCHLGGFWVSISSRS